MCNTLKISPGCVMEVLIWKKFLSYCNPIKHFSVLNHYIFQFYFTGFYHGVAEELHCYARTDAFL